MGGDERGDFVLVMGSIKLSELIKNAVAEKDLWLYNDSLDINPPNLEDEESCKYFISNYFEGAGKNIPVSLLHKINHERRIQHIVTAFFLGISIYSNSSFLKHVIDSELSRYDYALKYYHSRKPFAYVWFLICLTHDLGYVYENKGKDLEFKTYDDLIKKYGKLGRAEGVPELYASMIGPYFKYRADGMGMGTCKAVNDHGIVGAFITYNEFCKIRAKKRLEIEERKDGNLWVKELDDVYKLVAWIVGCHNLFFADTSNYCDMFKYMWYHLFSLIKEPTEYKIRIFDYPLFFFLQLIDNIEMMKLREVRYDYLNDLYLEIDDALQSLKIRIVKRKDDLDQNKFAEKYADRLYRLNTWLTKTELISDNSQEAGEINLKIYFVPK